MVVQRKYLLFASAITSGVAMSLLVPAAPDVHMADPALARLMLFMAAIKAAAGVALVAAVFWRLRAAGPEAAYAFCAGVLAAGPGLVADGHAGWGAMSFYGGVALCLIVAWMDRARWRRAIAGHLVWRRDARGHE